MSRPLAREEEPDPSQWLARTWVPPQGLRLEPAMADLVEALRHPIASAEDYQRLGQAMQRLHDTPLQGVVPPIIHALEQARAVEATAWKMWEKIVASRPANQRQNLVAVSLQCPRTKTLGWARSRFCLQVSTRDPKTGQVGYSDYQWPYAGPSRDAKNSAQDHFWAPIPTARLLNLLGAWQRVLPGQSIRLEVPAAPSWDAVSGAMFGTTPLGARMDEVLPRPSRAAPAPRL